MIKVKDSLGGFGSTTWWQSILLKNKDNFRWCKHILFHTSWGRQSLFPRVQRTPKWGGRIKNKEQGNSTDPRASLALGDQLPGWLHFWSSRAFLWTWKLSKFGFADMAPQTGAAPSWAETFISISPNACRSSKWTPMTVLSCHFIPVPFLPPIPTLGVVIQTSEMFLDYKELTWCRSGLGPHLSFN